MQMAYHLPSFFAGVNGDPVAPSGDTLVTGQCIGNFKDMSDDVKVIAFFKLGQICDMPYRHDEDMRWRLRVDVAEGYHFIIFM